MRKTTNLREADFNLSEAGRLNLPGLARLVIAVVIVAAIAVCAVAGPVAISGRGGQAVLAESAAAHNRVAAGYAHSLLIDGDGALWAWGRNTSGELGVAAYDTTDRLVPTRVGTATDWVSVAASWYHSFGIRSDGSLWAWGENDYGQLGLGYQYQRTTPARVGTGGNWVAVSAGHYHTLGLQSDGTLWAWGSNANGQLGLEGVPLTDNVTSPARVGAGTSWVAIAAGDGHSLAVSSDGSLWAWGLNSSGQLGLGDHTSRPQPTQAAGSIQFAQVDAEYNYSMGIDRDGHLYSWGNNYRGLLGQGDSTDRSSPDLVSAGWAGVYPGRTHCLGVSLDGSLYSWGSSYDGALGLGQSINMEMSPALVAGNSPAWTGGAGGDRFSMTLRSDGTAWGFGWNGNGQLGLNQHNEKFVPTLVTLGWPLSVATSPASGILEEGSTLNGSLVSLGDAASVQVCFEWGLTASCGSTTAAQTKTAAGVFSAALAGLTASTTYYYRARADAGGETVYGLGSTFTTAAPAVTPVAPTVSTVPGGAITPTSANLRGSLAALGTAGSVTVYFEYGTEAAPYSLRTPGRTLSAPGDFSADLTALAAGTIYCYRARADGDGTALGSGLNFQTESIPGISPEVDTADAEGITASSARLNGYLSSMGAAASVSVFFQWGTVSGSYPSESAALLRSAAGAFYLDVDGLAPDTTYYYRTRAAGEGSCYGEERSFTTAAASNGGDAQNGGNGGQNNGAGQSPQITAVQASGGQCGESLTVTISGANLSGATAIDFGSGITVKTFAVQSDGRITADISIADDANTGAREVSVTTGQGSGALEDGFSVSAGKGGFCSRGTASAASEVTVSMAALGLVLGTGYWITRKRAR